LPLSLSCIGQLWQQERPLLSSVSFQVFRPSPWMTCFVLLTMSLGLKFSVFFLLGLPIVGCALLGVIFCLNFGPFFFSSLLPFPGVLHLFI
jgi:hypothetical protein